MRRPPPPSRCRGMGRVGGPHKGTSTSQCGVCCGNHVCYEGLHLTMSQEKENPNISKCASYGRDHTSTLTLGIHWACHVATLPTF